MRTIVFNARPKSGLRRAHPVATGQTGRDVIPHGGMRREEPHEERSGSGLARPHQAQWSFMEEVSELE